MFQSLPHTLKKHGIDADARTLFEFITAIDIGLVHTVGDAYVVLEKLVVHNSRQRGPYTKAFYEYFLGLYIGDGATLEEAVFYSFAFNEWRSTVGRSREPTQSNPVVVPFNPDVDPHLVGIYLDLVHETSFGNRRHPSLDTKIQNNDTNPRNEGDIHVPFTEGLSPPKEGIDYSAMTSADLEALLQKRLAEQKEAHSGGKKWVGTGGRSPFGHDGNANGGIRVGGKGNSTMARLVIDNAAFYPVNKDGILNDDNVDATLAALKGVEEIGTDYELDLDGTIRQAADHGGLVLPMTRLVEKKRLHVALFIDNGGSSMDRYSQLVQNLFRKMKTRFTHDLRCFYFHNIIAGEVYEDERRREKPFSFENVLGLSNEYRVFIVGDASMDYGELSYMDYWKRGYSGVTCLEQLKGHFPRLAWLNPVRENNWRDTYTINRIGQIVDMYPLTPAGIERAVQRMNTL